jgi:predicted nucleic acid-binding protein
MPSPRLFLDSSVLFAGVVSPSGAARALLLLGEAELIELTVSEQVVAETERALARKVPRALPHYREALRSTGIRIVRDPSPDEVETHKGIITHQADVPIIVAAMKSKPDYLVTHNRRHFTDDPDVATRSGLRIGTPGDALAWVREQLAREIG